MAHFLPNLKHFKICVLAETGVGKSALIIQFVQSQFADDYDPTLQDTYSRVITYQDKARGESTGYVLDILDTVGIEDYTESREIQIKESDAIILCYNVCSKRTYDIVTLLHQQVLRCCSLDEDYEDRAQAEEDEHINLPPIILCGTQSDLVNQRQVSYQDGELLLEELKLDHFFEVSSKLKVNVEELFLETVRLIIEKQKAKNSRSATPAPTTTTTATYSVKVKNPNKPSRALSGASSYEANANAPSTVNHQKTISVLQQQQDAQHSKSMTTKTKTSQPAGNTTTGEGSASASAPAAATQRTTQQTALASSSAKKNTTNQSTCCIIM